MAQLVWLKVMSKHRAARKGARLAPPRPHGEQSREPAVFCTERHRASRDGSSLRAMDLPACTGSDLLLGFLLVCVSGARAYWLGGRAARGGLPGLDARGALARVTAVVRAIALLGQLERRDARHDRLGRTDLVAAAGVQRLAEAERRALHDLLSVVHRRLTGFLIVSVGRDAAGGGLPLDLLRAARRSARPRQRGSAHTQRDKQAAKRKKPDLFRVRSRQDSERRSPLT